MEDQPSLERKFKSVIYDLDSISVQDQSFQISEKPMKSEGYYRATGVVLFGKNMHALTHFSHKHSLPEVYLSEIVDQMEVFGEDELEAVLMGGNRSHFIRIHKLLGEYPFTLIGGLWEVGSKRKDLVIVPTTREVIMYSYAGEGYYKLA